MSVIERYVCETLRNQDGRNTQGMANSQLVVYIRITTCDVGNHRSGSPDLIPNILDNRGSSVNVICLGSRQSGLSCRRLNNSAEVFEVGLVKWHEHEATCGIDVRSKNHRIQFL